MDYYCLLTQKLGGNLVSSRGLIYLGNDTSDTDFKSVDKLVLSIDGLDFCFGCAADGESIVISQDNINNINMGDYGSMVVRVLSNINPYLPAMSSALLQVSEIVNQSSIQRVGVVLCFGGGDVVVCNIGDELCVFDSLPYKILNHENWNVIHS